MKCSSIYFRLDIKLFDLYFIFLLGLWCANRRRDGMRGDGDRKEMGNGTKERLSAEKSADSERQSEKGKNAKMGK